MQMQQLTGKRGNCEWTWGILWSGSWTR